MARQNLAHINFPRKWRRFANDAGSFTVKDSGGTAAPVYASATGATEITGPYPFIYGGTPVGWLNPGRYTFTDSDGLFEWDYDVPGESAESDLRHFSDTSLGPRTIPYHLCNSDLVTLTSGTVIFAKLEPVTTTTTVDTLTVVTGQTESATETDQRLGLYSSDGTTLTRIDQSAASTTLLDTDDTVVTAALAGGNTDLSPGTDYYVAILSVASTAGTLVGWTPVGIGAATPALAATHAPLNAYTLGSQTALDATEAISGATASAIIPFAQATLVS